MELRWSRVILEYPYPNYPWTTPLSPNEREGHYIDFLVLALNAVTAYLKLMPTLWEAE